MSSILIIDDETAPVTSLAFALRGEGQAVEGDLSGIETPSPATAGPAGGPRT